MLFVENALKSVHSWADEIIIVDMYSDDHTVDIANRYTSNIYYHERIKFVEPARKFGVTKAKGNWILILDPDEVVPYTLSRKLLDIANNDLADVVEIPWCNYFFGKRVNYSGWGRHQDYHPRFFKRQFIEFPGEVHGAFSIQENARILKLKSDDSYYVVHFNYVDIFQFIEKLNRYTSIEAEQSYELYKDHSTKKFLVWSVRGFIRRYIKQKGYLDGWRGTYLSLFWAFYRIVLAAKVTQIKEEGRSINVIHKYQELANQVIKDYEGN